MQTRGPLAGILVALVLPGYALAESAWVRFDPDLPGDAAAEVRSGWSVVEGFGLDSVLAQGQPGSFILTRPADRSTGPLSAALTDGRTFPRVDIDIASVGKDSDDSPRAVRVRLEEVVLLSQGLEWRGPGESPREMLELGFRSITYAYYLPEADAGGTFLHFDYETLEGEAGAFTDEDPIDGRGGDPVAPPFQVRLDRFDSAAGTMKLSWDSEEGTDYTIEWTPDLVAPFEAIETIRAEDSETEFEIPVEGPTGFYRIRID